MRILQAGLVSILVITLSASLPGLYYRTESSSPEPSTAAQSGSNARELDLTSLQDLSKPDPEPEQLPQTSFSLKRLSGAARKRAEKILKVDINSAGAEQLTTLYGVSESIARDIIQYREDVGKITSVSELKDIPNIGPITAKRIGQEILIEGRSPSVDLPAGDNGGSDSNVRINLNTASASELQVLDGIGPTTAKKIIEYRRRNGAFSDVDELTSISGIGPATVDKLRENTVL